jgi:hypothetical protein
LVLSFVIQFLVLPCAGLYIKSISQEKDRQSIAKVECSEERLTCVGKSSGF